MDYKFINPEYLDSVSGGDPEIIREIVNMFKDQSIEIYNEMESHLSDKNYTSLGLLAHKAKSSVAIMGMNDLAQTLKTFEQEAKEGIGSELYESYLFKFKTETEGAFIELDNLLSNLSNKS